MYIYNSLNHGIITHSGITSGVLSLGGIVGYTEGTTIENCVSGGKISSTKTSYIGSIVGRVYSYTSINYCYYTSELGSYKEYGTGTPSESNFFSYNSTSFELDRTVSIGSYTSNSLIDALNAAVDYYILREYSRWVLNKNNKAVSFTINGRANSIKMNYKIILLPSLANEGNMTFDGWYEGSELTTLLTSYEIMSDTELYGRLSENTNNYTISFDTRKEGSSVAPITAPFSSVVTLPSDLTKEHCTFVWWETEYGDKIELSFAIPSHDITIYAVWKCTHIETPEDFIDFSKIVNKGVDSFTGTTVFLDSDLSLAGKSFEPIGIDTSKYFLGVFDGQGHVISNLKMNPSSSEYVGLFGYSYGLTIKNVILDSSCSITSTFSGSNYVRTGSIMEIVEQKMDPASTRTT